MTTVIIFFVGLIIMVSGNQVGIMTNIPYTSLICNALGGMLMGYGAVVCYRFAQRKGNDIKAFANQMVGKEEHESELAVLKSIESVLVDNQNVLLELARQQNEFNETYRNNCALSQENIENLKESILIELDAIKNINKEIQKNSEEQNATISKVINGIKEAVEKVHADNIETMAGITTIHADDIEIKASIENGVTKIQEISSEAIEKLIVSFEELKNISKEIQKNSEEQNAGVSKVINRIDEVIEKVHADDIEIQNRIENEIVKMQEISDEIVRKFEGVYGRIDNMNAMPLMVSESVDELVTKFSEFLEDIQTKFEYLEEDLEEQDEKRTRKFNDIMEEIRDATEDNNENVAEEIKRLGEQYEQFKNTISAIVQQMSSIAEEDIKVMKGFLNG